MYYAMRASAPSPTVHRESTDYSIYNSVNGSKFNIWLCTLPVISLPSSDHTLGRISITCSRSTYIYNGEREFVCVCVCV